MKKKKPDFAKEGKNLAKHIVNVVASYCRFKPTFMPKMALSSNKTSTVQSRLSEEIADWLNQAYQLGRMQK